MLVLMQTNPMLRQMLKWALYSSLSSDGALLPRELLDSELVGTQFIAARGNGGCANAWSVPSDDFAVPEMSYTRIEGVYLRTCLPPSV